MVRIYHQLKDEGLSITEDKVSERMKVLGLVSKVARRFVKTTDSQNNQYTRPNILQQQFEASKPNEKYVTDITYIPTDEGFMYLCVFLDLYSRAVVGWSMADHMKAELVCDALMMAMFRKGRTKGVLVHSDKGSQYISEKFQKIIDKNSLVSSGSGTGCCYDNAACESFFGTLKVELCDDENYKTIDEAKTSVFEYIEGCYNTKRKHSSINYFTPKQYEDMMESQQEKCPKFSG
ncbi:IS3 family transposase [Francisellaceae bacterium]|nr:IS3 family transposase [Francisellaceae bacterium]